MTACAAAAPPDPILGVAAAFKEDPSADKVNLVRLPDASFRLPFPISAISSLSAREVLADLSTQVTGLRKFIWGVRIRSRFLP